jgi:hypothetical protein
MLQGGAEFQRKRVLTKAAGNWSKEFLRTTNMGWGRVQRVAGAGVTSDLMDSKRLGWECMIHLQKAENTRSPGATTWAADLLNRDGESREFSGLWFASDAVHEAKKRRVTQVITCSFPCGKWLHMIKARASQAVNFQTRERTRASGDASTTRGKGSAHSNCRVHGAEEKCHR